MQNKASTESLAANRSATLFQPGQSGNPSGRPKSFGAFVRSSTLEGEELVQYALDIMRGVKVIEGHPELGFRAMEWLADRGWGKAVLNVEHTGTAIHAWEILKGLSDEQLEAIAQAASAQNEARANAIEGEGRVLTDDGERGDA